MLVYGNEYAIASGDVHVFANAANAANYCSNATWTVIECANASGACHVYANTVGNGLDFANASWAGNECATAAMDGYDCANQFELATF